ncbi:MAG: ABC transporter substrate-binding protein [Lachnospiraceae bacterium]|nr:ABC transporter substrate-binding protein [Lachnospiraceae bacterium]
MKRLLSVILVLSMCVSLISCANTTQNVETVAEVAEATEETQTAEVAETHIVVDHGGNEVEVPNKIERIVVTDIFPIPAVLSVFFNSADKIVGIAPTSMSAAKNSLLSKIYPEILNANADFMNGNVINVEELMKLNPDVVFYSENNNEQKEVLTKAGFCAIGISANGWHYDCIETLNHWLQTLTEVFKYSDDISILTERSDKAQKMSNEIYDMIKERVSKLSKEEKKRVFFLFQYNDSTMLTSGKNFFGEWWAEAVGCINVAEELEKDNSVATNLEQVYAWNPDMIFITNFTTALPKDLYENTIGNYDWSEVKAVKDREVYKLPLGMYRTYTPGIDTPITLLWFAKTAYPGLFSDVDLVKETREYYKNIFDVDLTDDEIKSIFNPDANAGRTYFN